MELMKHTAFTLPELLISMGSSSIILAALLLSSTSLTKTFSATESFSRTQSAQIRVIDSIAIDLRRAVKVGLTTAPGSNPASETNTLTKLSMDGVKTMSLIDGTFNPITRQPGGSRRPSNYLRLSIPDFYQSNDPASSMYRQLTTLITTGSAVKYGTAAGVATETTVEYRMQYQDRFASECIIRREAGVDRVIAAQCELIDVDITAYPNNTFTIETLFIPTFSNARSRSSARITSSDRVMLRNSRID